MAAQQTIIVRLNPYQPEAERLITESNSYLTSLYPSGSTYLESQKGLSARNVLFLGCQVDHEIVGCGAVKILADKTGRFGELKRLFVFESHRGQGVSKRLLEALEGHFVRGCVFMQA